MQAQLDKNTTNSQETRQEESKEHQPKKQPIQEHPPQDLEGVHYGEAREAEMVDWEAIFSKHLEETRRMETERQEQIDKAYKKETNWEVLRECTSFLRENEKTWKIDLEKP